MELDSQTLSSFVIGAVVGVLLCVAIVVLTRRQLRFSNRSQIEQYEQTILDLRQERAEGRETNRRIRHELAISTPEHLESTRAELAASEATVADLRARLVDGGEQLAIRDRSLREARLAIQEIRMQLEEGRFGDASAQSAEYLEHGLDPDDSSAAELSLTHAVMTDPLDDGVVAAQIDDADDADADAEAEHDGESESDEAVPGAEAADGDDSDDGASGDEDEDGEILVGDAGPGEPVA